jgi:hypothetical protein
MQVTSCAAASIIAIALSLSPAAGRAQSAAGYWRQQGETTFSFCGGQKTQAECRDMTVGNERFEMLEWGPGHATLRVSGVTGGGFNTMTWRAEWLVPQLVIPGQVIGVTTKATVIALSYGSPQWPKSFYLPGAEFRGHGAVSVLDTDMTPVARSQGQSGTHSNSAVRAPVVPPGIDGGSGSIEVRGMEQLVASIPYVWVKGTPPPAGDAVSGWWRATDPTWGEFLLSRRGGTVDGPYRNHQGVFTTTQSGNTITGYWVEKSSKQPCATTRDGSVHWGRIQLTFEGASFRGAWGYCDEKVHYVVEGSRR